jgi:glycosyltransferase involved in cell wall biosynthesis
MSPISGDIVIIGLQPWDIKIGSNCKNIALEFAKHHRVFYVNTPLDRKTIWNDRTKPEIDKRIRIRNGQEPAVEQIQENLWTYYPSCILESINWLKPHFLFRAINYLNNKRFANDIQKLLKQFNSTQFTLFNDNSIYLGFHQKELLKPDCYVYYIRDNLTKNNYWGYHASRMEHLLIAKADCVVTNSVYYTRYAAKHNPNSFMIGQGCDFTAFDNPGRIPVELEKLAHPIIGYVGHLSSRRLNIGLIENLAEKNPNWSIVLVGHEDEIFKTSRLHSISNVIFTGPKKPEELGTYVNAFDICINPQKVNDATIGNYPRKIDEYLYLGKPTIASKTEAMEYFNGYVYLGNNAAEYEALIRLALTEDNIQLQNSRKKFASAHTWQQSVEEIYNAFESCR